jgi:hypothetical protein
MTHSRGVFQGCSVRSPDPDGSVRRADMPQPCTRLSDAHSPSCRQSSAHDAAYTFTRYAVILLCAFLCAVTLTLAADALGTRRSIFPNVRSQRGAFAAFRPQPQPRGHTVQPQSHMQAGGENWPDAVVLVAAGQGYTGRQVRQHIDLRYEWQCTLIRVKLACLVAVMLGKL